MTHHPFERIIHFWFEEIESEYWFMKDDKFDQLLRDRFAKIHAQAMAGETSPWRAWPDGRLAEIIVLDQFSRNMFRGTARAFASDAQALKLAQEAVSVGDDLKINIKKRSFIYMPYMHSEDLQVHAKAVELFSQEGLEHGLKFELLHKKIIERFGRYPHRNEILGRASTAEETKFLQESGSSF